MNLFVETSYRVALRKLIEQRKLIDAKFHFQAIAEATRIPKSYISKVTTEKAHFNADQLYAVCEYLGLTEAQIRFLTSLLEWERSTHKARRQVLDRDIAAMRDRALDSREYLKAGQAGLTEALLREYYLDPLNQLVHICLSIPRYQSNPGALAADLNLPAADLRQIIQILEVLGVIEQQGGKVRTLIKSVHLPKSSPAYRPWRNQLRLLCLERLSRTPRKEDYSFSATFSTTTKVRGQIKAEFLELIKRAEQLSQNSRIEDTYQLNFDLFGWTDES